MENQHRLIKGYRELTEEEIALMNQIKAMGTELNAVLDLVANVHNVDKRFLAIGKTQLQLGFMAAIRSIARPETFC